MIVIGLTGPIAAGKSVVLQEFRRLGAVTIEADAVSRELLQPGSSLLGEVIAEFGASYLDENGQLRRGALGELIFADREARRRLERIVHPAMVERMREAIERHRGRAGPDAVVIEAANIAQMGIMELVDTVVMVTAPLEVRLQRLMERNGTTEDSARRRLRLHEELEIDRTEADYVIGTRGSEAETRRQAERVWLEAVK